MNMNTKKCIYCVADIPTSATKCSHCGEWLTKKELSLRNPLIKTSLYFLAFFTIWLAIVKFVIPYMTESLTTMDKYTQVPYDKKSNGLVFKNVKEMRRKNSLSILGQIENKSKTTYHSVDIYVTYYDKNNQMIDIDSTYFSTLSPGTINDFKVLFACDKDDKKNYKEYHHFEIKVNNTYKFKDGH